MSYDTYQVFVAGAKLDWDAFDHMKYEQTFIKEVPPKTKFNPNTGKPNLPTQQTITYYNWKKEYLDLANVIDMEYNEENYDDLYNGGLPYKDVWIVETWAGELFVTSNKDDVFYLPEKEGVVEFEFPDLEVIAEKIKPTLTDLKLWDPDSIGLWLHTYRA